MSAQTTLICPELIRQDGDRLSLMGSCCSECGETYFPAAHACTRCRSTLLEAFDLGAEGTLWSWTVQGFLPKPPYNSGETQADFKPYGVGYVEMPCGLKVEARLTESEPSRLHIGMPMRLVLDPYRRQVDDGPNATYAFAPR